ncbi:hypothetical protein H8D30_05520 [bacterium]|nr:hypothetical protein [bacterium]
MKSLVGLLALVVWGGSLGLEEAGERLPLVTVFGFPTEPMPGCAAVLEEGQVVSVALLADGDDLCWWCSGVSSCERIQRTEINRSPAGMIECCNDIQSSCEQPIYHVTYAQSCVASTEKCGTICKKRWDGSTYAPSLAEVTIVEFNCLGCLYDCSDLVPNVPVGMEEVVAGSGSIQCKACKKCCLN